jgi:hypothetical protein
MERTTQRRLLLACQLAALSVSLTIAGLSTHLTVVYAGSQGSCQSCCGGWPTCPSQCDSDPNIGCNMNYTCNCSSCSYVCTLRP